MTKKRNGFQFKQFFVAHDKCAMKVTTDAILLGSWANVTSQTESVLDIGTGSGVLALMLAQRTTKYTKIDAIELENSAVEQAHANFLASDWHDKLKVIHGNIIDYAASSVNRYDVIVSNPPYFTSGVACHSAERNLARYTESLTHEQLLWSAQKLLKQTGRLYLVLPTSVVEHFMELAIQMGWFLGEQLYVKEQENRLPHLLLLEMALYPLNSGQINSGQKIGNDDENADKSEKTLIIRHNDGLYSDAYRQLAKAFYLAF